MTLARLRRHARSIASAGASGILWAPALDGGEAMHRVYRTAHICLTVSTAMIACAVHAETPGEIAKPWTYEGSKKLQEQQRQQDQQFQQQPSAPQGNVRANPSGGGAAGAALDAARRDWQKQPALPPERNPLLGKWTRPPSTRANSNDPFAQLQALAKGGMCEVLFGGGVFEFRADRLVGMDERTREQELDRVEYRGSEKRVVVLPKTTINLMEFDVEGPNRINWKSQNCVLVRAGAPATAAAAAAPPRAATGGVLELSVGALSASDKIAGRKLWVLKGDPQFALIKGGLTSTPDGSVLQNWMRACDRKDQACAAGMQALRAYSVGFVQTDAAGRAQTPPLPTGRYWVLSDARIDNKHMMWNEIVDVKGTSASVTLDRRNVMPVE
jgi:hypothetical protein